MKTLFIFGTYKSDVYDKISNIARIIGYTPVTYPQLEKFAASCGVTPKDFEQFAVTILGGFDKFIFLDDIISDSPQLALNAELVSDSIFEDKNMDVDSLINEIWEDIK